MDPFQGGIYRRRKREILLYNLVLFICGAISMFSLSHAYVEHRLVLPWAIFALFLMFALTTICQWSMHNMRMREEASLRPVVLTPVVIPSHNQQLPFYIQNGHLRQDQNQVQANAHAHANANISTEGESSEFSIAIDGISSSSGLPKYEHPPNYAQAMNDTIVIEGNK